MDEATVIPTGMAMAGSRAAAKRKLLPMDIVMESSMGNTTVHVTMSAVCFHSKDNIIVVADSFLVLLNIDLFLLFSL